MFRKLFMALVVMLAVGCAGTGKGVAEDEVPRMTVEELKAKLGSPDVVVLDVRKPSDWEAAEAKITGAIRENPRSFEEWADKYPKDKTLVLYCT